MHLRIKGTIMTVIAIDIQPQYRFSCTAANEQRFLHQPEKIVAALNSQARLADKRALVENIAPDTGLLCRNCIDAPLNRSGFVFNRELGRCRSTHLFHGLPCPADYDFSVETDRHYRHGACFHDSGELHSTGLMEWIHAHYADTVIIGGLATEEAVCNTAKQLMWYNNDIHVIVNLSACCGYSPQSTIEAIRSMRATGVTVVTDASSLPEALGRYSGFHSVKVS